VQLLELDDRVTEAVAQLKARGFASPYLNAFVVAMLKAAQRFDAAKVRIGDLAAASVPPVEE